MAGIQAGRRDAFPEAAVGIALGAMLGLGSPAAALEAPDAAPVSGAGAGHVDIAAELAAVPWAAGGAMPSLAAPSGDAWASTQQYPGRPHERYVGDRSGSGWATGTQRLLPRHPRPIPQRLGQVGNPPSA